MQNAENLIIGGGAAGLAAACALVQRGCAVTLLEKQARVGRKLLATGNGRCNLTHMGATARDYHGARGAVQAALNRFPPEQVRAFFASLGVSTVEDEEGRVYPMSRQAASVLDALRLYLQESNAEVIPNCAAEEVRRDRRGFEVRAGEQTFLARRVLIATGGLAAPKLGACGDGYRMLERLGHASGTRFPAIAALKTPPEPVRGLKGQRIECELALEIDEKVARIERGEVLFSESGLSGIAAMQLARACNEALRAKKSCRVSLSILPCGGRSALDARVKALPDRAIEDLLSGIVPKRVGMALAKAAGIEPLNRAARTLTGAELARLGALLERWTMQITATEGFDQAQVTAGGVDLSVFDWDTLESRRVPGLYIAGELADVDGDCGGYNLQWAFASALTAAAAMSARSE